MCVLSLVLLAGCGGNGGRADTEPALEERDAYDPDLRSRMEQDIRAEIENRILGGKSGVTVKGDPHVACVPQDPRVVNCTATLDVDAGQFTTEITVEIGGTVEPSGDYEWRVVKTTDDGLTPE